MPSETRSVDTGLPGVSMVPGDHICAFYRGNDQRDDVLVPYLRAGLLSGEKCISVVDLVDPQWLATAVEDVPQRAAGQLTLHRSEQTYLVGGRFRMEHMLAFWDEGTIAALDAGDYDFVRLSGEMTWALRQAPGVDQLVPYEAALNRSLPRYPRVALCMYDLERFTDGELVLDILRTHPKVLMGGAVIDNPWYVEPDHFLATSS